MRYILIISFLLGAFNITYSQLGIQFENTVHDYGTIREEGGVVHARFNFVNVSDKAIKLVSVRPSCGCTASDWTSHAVEPGDSGYVTSAFNPLHRPGYFNKSITVVTDESHNSALTLRIKGNVIAKPKIKADDYPFSMGALRFKNNHLAFGDVRTNQVKTDSFAVMNNGSVPISIRFPQLPAFLKVYARPQVLQPETEGFIVVEYDGSKRGDWGLLFDRFTMLTDDREQEYKSLNVSANIIQDFSHLSPRELSRSPRIEFEESIYDFGTIKQGEIIEIDFVFRNAGRNILQIHKINSDCGCTVSKPENDKIKRKKKSRIGVVFNSAGRVGRQNLTINIINNDPLQSNYVLTVSGTVEQ